MAKITSGRLRDLTSPQRLRKGWFAVLTRSADMYLRSPLFLVWMRHSLSAASELQSLQADGFSRLLPKWLPRPPRREAEAAPHSSGRPHS